jgi:splicing factor 1
LHAYITGPTIEAVAKAVEKVQYLVKQGIEVPEFMNEFRKQQLRELALINGTLRENDSLK